VGEGSKEKTKKEETPRSLASYPIVGWGEKKHSFRFRRDPKKGRCPAPKILPRNVLPQVKIEDMEHVGRRIEQIQVSSRGKGHGGRGKRPVELAWDFGGWVSKESAGAKDKLFKRTPLREV